ncbi:hypothetical protein HUU39_10055 [candidate division KSB1 bacterium]|nr:hypothetical protein [bacterium]NUM65600.1 hypothetical protein [candidate division KSB1 bacterium]
MKVLAYEGIVDNGLIRLEENVQLPEKTRVYVIVPDWEAKRVAHVYSPRLVHPEQAKDFVKEMMVIEGPSDASI